MVIPSILSEPLSFNKSHCSASQALQSSSYTTCGYFSLRVSSHCQSNRCTSLNENECYNKSDSTEKYLIYLWKFIITSNGWCSPANDILSFYEGKPNKNICNRKVEFIFNK